MDRSDLKKMWNADQGDGTYKNPILYTDYSDPDVIRVGADYFMVSSSFCNAPAVPLLHSKDLINWKVINYIMDRLPFSRYDEPVHGCGVYAPSIRFHDGIYYVFVPMPDEGIFVCKTTDPWGKWSEPYCLRKVAGWIDPCPFWDDDGKAYMVSAFARSRIGFNSYLYVTPIEPDCSGILDDGRFVYDGHQTQPVIEGPKLHKRNGYYYIFAPAGSVTNGWQTVLRSRNIYGPYEEKIVLHQGNTSVNGPHQGAWIDTQTGEDWFIHFQDVGNAGRIIHLQPMYWENDWPVIGVNAENGCGEPAVSCKKPDVGAVYPMDSPEDSDFFEEEKLGLQWQWNANAKKEWYSLQDHQLILNAQPVNAQTQLCDISNLLIQKWPAPEFRVTTCIHLENMQDGDAAGMVSHCCHYTGLLIRKEKGKFYVQQRTGNMEKDDEIRKDLGEVYGTTVTLRMTVKEEQYVSFEVSCEESGFRAVGETVEASPGRWVGVKIGLAAVNEAENIGGSIRADYFVFESLKKEDCAHEI